MVGIAVGCWILSEALTQLRGNKLGDIPFGFYPCWFAVLFVRGISYSGDALYIFVMTLLKNKQTSCVVPAKGLYVFISSWKVGPQGLWKDLAAHANSFPGTEGHTYLLSVRFLEHKEDWPKQYPWVEQQIGEHVQQSKVSAQKHHLCMTSCR